MALVQIDKMMRRAVDEGYITGAFNVFNLDTLVAVLEAAQSENSPVIVQVSMGSRKYQPYFSAFLESVKLFAREVKIPVALNHDHCQTVEHALEAIDLGVGSVMFDGSHLSFEENAAKTKKVADYAHARGAFVEAELGRLPGFEDEVFAQSAQFTKPELAATFIRLTGCDALAVSVGTSHGGVNASGDMPLHFEVLADIRKAIGPEFPLVLHGAASLPEELVQEVNRWGANVPQMRNCSEQDIAKAAAYGVYKANMDVDNHLAYTAAVRQNLIRVTEKYDPRSYLKAGREAFALEVRHKLRNVCHSSGKAW